jgi:hypothetical protein
MIPVVQVSSRSGLTIDAYLPGAEDVSEGQWLGIVWTISSVLGREYRQHMSGTTYFADWGFPAHAQLHLSNRSHGFDTLNVAETKRALKRAFRDLGFVVLPEHTRAAWDYFHPSEQ